MFGQYIDQAMELVTRLNTFNAKDYFCLLEAVCHLSRLAEFAEVIIKVINPKLFPFEESNNTFATLSLNNKDNQDAQAVILNMFSYVGWAYSHSDSDNAFASCFKGIEVVERADISFDSLSDEGQVNLLNLYIYAATIKNQQLNAKSEEIYSLYARARKFVQTSVVSTDEKSDNVQVLYRLILKREVHYGGIAACIPGTVIPSFI